MNRKERQFDSVVVGGGIAGILAALLRAEEGKSVILLESGKHIGGLLRSSPGESGDSFDFGTHFIVKSGIEEVDRLMVRPEWTEEWNEYSNEHGGNFFGGELSDDCLFVNSNKLPPESYERCMSEFLNIRDWPNESENLEDQLDSVFGSEFRRDLFTPIMGKLYGSTELDQLATDAHVRFGMKRIVATTPEETRRLKAEESAHDARLAFHSFREGSASRPQYYPEYEGCGVWVERLREALIAANVEIAESSQVERLEGENCHLNSVVLKNGENITCKEVVWSGPTFPLIKQFEPSLLSLVVQMRRTTIVNLTIDQAPRCDCHFFFCYDPNYSPLRVTLYSNLQPLEASRTGRHRITVEVLSDEQLDSSIVDLVARELREMNIVDHEANILYQNISPVSSGFPVLTKSFQEIQSIAVERLENRFENLILCGRGSGTTWFMADVMADVYNRIRK